MALAMPRSLKDSEWAFPEQVWEGLSEHARQFVVGEFTGMRTPDYYRSRLDWMGFTGGEKVLDVACGMGQWTVMLAERYGQVHGVDLTPMYLEVAKGLVLGNQCKNVQLSLGRMEELPYPDSHFDALMCYGAFMFGEMGKAAYEFARVLKPGGRLYTNANGWGWFAHLLLDRGLRASNKAVLQMTAVTTLNTVLGRPANIFVTGYQLRSLLASRSFKILHTGPEGSAPFGTGTPPEPAYAPSFYGIRSMNEVVAVRSGR